MIVYIVISFVMHIFTILAIIILYQRRSWERVTLPTLEEDVETIQQSMQRFINEIEKENEALYEQIDTLLAEKMIVLENQVEALEKRLMEIKAGADDVSTENCQQVAIPESNLPQLEQVIELSRQGFNVEQISRTLQIGKGEVSLMINLVNKLEKNKD